MGYPAFPTPAQGSPASPGTVFGPGSSVVGDFALWNNTVGTLLKDATPTQVTALLNQFTASLQGLVPASGGGTTNFLRADGTFAAPPAPALTLLGTITASGSPTTLSAITHLTNAYSEYELVFEQLVPGTNASALSFQVYSGGAFNTSGYVAMANFVTSAASTVATSSTTAIPLTYSANAFNGAPGVNGRMLLHNPSATAICACEGEVIYAQSASAGYAGVNFGYWNTAAAITGFQFSFGGTVTFSSGTVRIYGRN